MTEGTVSYRIFAALDEAAPFDLFLSNLIDDEEDLDIFTDNSDEPNYLVFEENFAA